MRKSLLFVLLALTALYLLGHYSPEPSPKIAPPSYSGAAPTPHAAPDGGTRYTASSIEVKEFDECPALYNVSHHRIGTLCKEPWGGLRLYK